MHKQKETLKVDINLPDHAPRRESKLFSKTAKEMKGKMGCWICGSKKKLEAHHHPIEWSLAKMIDFGPLSQIRKDFPQFDWAGFDAAGRDPYLFVDDMRVNGLILCQDHHRTISQGIHDLPFPLWVAQRYAQEGYHFSDTEIIHHQKDTK